MDRAHAFSYRVQPFKYDPVPTSEHLSNFPLLSFVLTRQNLYLVEINIFVYDVIL